MSSNVDTIRMSNKDSIFVRDADYISFNKPRNTSISFSLGSANEPSVTLRGDGSVEFHEGYPLNEINKVFWECLASSNPLLDEVRRLKQENERLRASSTVIHSLELPVQTTLVRVEFDGQELRARAGEGSWQTVRVST
jgi:hypothetical protein